LYYSVQFAVDSLIIASISWPSTTQIFGPPVSPWGRRATDRRWPVPKAAIRSFGWWMVGSLLLGLWTAQRSAGRV